MNFTPAHRRKRSAFDRQVLGVLVRPPNTTLGGHHRYILGQVALGNVKWSHRGGRAHWQCDHTDVSTSLQGMTARGWVHVTGSDHSRERHATLTPEGSKKLAEE